MSFNNPPSKFEVMSWKPHALANYMKKVNLTGCIKVVIQDNITGADFMQMAECDLHVFPSHHVQKITELQRAIADNEHSTSFSQRLNHKQNHRQAVQQQEEDYGQFEQNVYEIDNPVCSLIKSQQYQNIYRDYDYEPSSTKSKPKTHKTDTTQRSGKIPEGSVHKALDLSSCNPPQICPDVSKRALKSPPKSPVLEEALDPSWYRRELTRRQAEVALREVNKDGSFVVRDSSKGRAEHPYTLMVLKEGKVYNIKIRKQGDTFFLSTGLHSTKSYPGVKEMITHHAHTPLMLIDAMDRSSEMKSKCCLLYPVGLEQ